MSIRIAPSLLSADFAHLAREVADVQRAGADLLHLDIMDGCFVPNLSFGPPVVQRLTACCELPLDAHLMVCDPDALVPSLAAAGVQRVAIHVEACRHLHRSLEGIRTRGMAAGIAINPATALHAPEDALPFADFVLVMSVNPGFGGQSFIPESEDKIRRLSELCAGREIDITVDGGVGPDNAARLAAAGAAPVEQRDRAVDPLRVAVLGAIEQEVRPLIARRQMIAREGVDNRHRAAGSIGLSQ